MPVRTTDHDGEDEDYLLGGGELEWDSSSRRFTKTCQAYVPPAIPSTSTLPTIEDFRLLKTVGKGAFGKVVKMKSRMKYDMPLLFDASLFSGDSSGAQFHSNTVCIESCSKVENHNPEADRTNHHRNTDS